MTDKLLRSPGDKTGSQSLYTVEVQSTFTQLDSSHIVLLGVYEVFTPAVGKPLQGYSLRLNERDMTMSIGVVSYINLYLIMVSFLLTICNSFDTVRYTYTIRC